MSKQTIQNFSTKDYHQWRSGNSVEWGYRCIPWRKPWYTHTSVFSMYVYAFVFMSVCIICSHVYTHIYIYTFSGKSRFLVLGIKPKTMQLLHKSSNSEQHHKSQQASFVYLFFFYIRGHYWRDIGTKYFDKHFVVYQRFSSLSCLLNF